MYEIGVVTLTTLENILVFQACIDVLTKYCFV
jgi:hypothetical protein